MIKNLTTLGANRIVFDDEDAQGFHATVCLDRADLETMLKALDAVEPKPQPKPLDPRIGVLQRANGITLYYVVLNGRTIHRRKATELEAILEEYDLDHQPA